MSRRYDQDGVAQRLPLAHGMLASDWQLPAAKLSSAVQPQGAQSSDQL